MLAFFFRDLLTEVVKHLSGRDVRVLWQQPPDGFRHGLCQRSGDVCEVYISPDLDADAAFDVALHEAAHARLHWPHMASGDAAAAGKASVAPQLAALGAQLKAARWEYEARSCAARWEAQSKIHAAAISPKLAETVTGRCMALLSRKVTT